MPNRYAGRFTSSLTGPAGNAAAVTPSDSAVLQPLARALYVGTAGDVAVTMASGDTVTLVAVPAGDVLAVAVFLDPTPAAATLARWGRRGISSGRIGI